MFFFAIASQDFPQRVTWSFVQDMMAEFKPSMANSALGTFVQGKLDYYHNLSNDKLTAMSAKVDKIKDVMIDNIEKLAFRGESLEVVQSKFDDIHEDAYEFKKTTAKLKNNSCNVQ